MFKKTILPYDEKEAEKQRERFWKDQNQYNYPKRGVLPIQEQDLSDREAFREAIDGEVDKYYLLKKLTPRQREMVELKVAGFNQKEIAEKMGLSYRTIKSEFALLRKICS